MISILIRWVILTIAIGITAYIVPGVDFQGGIFSLIWVAAIFGVVNAVVRPILTLLTCPFVLLTLGLFMLVINTLMFMLTARLTDALDVSSFWSALFASVIISIISAVLTMVIGDDKDDDD